MAFFKKGDKVRLTYCSYSNSKIGLTKGSIGYVLENDSTTPYVSFEKFKDLTPRELMDYADEHAGSKMCIDIEEEDLELIERENGLKGSTKAKNKDKTLKTSVDYKLKNNKKEEVRGMNLAGNLTKMLGEMGQIKDGSVALTMEGAVAFKNKDGDYVRYNTETEQLENKGEFVIAEAGEMMMIFPSMTVAEGDVIKKKNKYYQVLKVNDNGSLKVADLIKGTKTTLMKEANIVGMNFYSKVVNLFTGLDGGNGTLAGMQQMLPLMFLLKDKEEGKDVEINGEGKSKKDLLMLLVMSQVMQGKNNVGNPMMSVMPMLMLAGGKQDGNMMEMFMLSQMFAGGGNGLFDTPTKAPEIKVNNEKFDVSNLDTIINEKVGKAVKEAIKPITAGIDDKFSQIMNALTSSTAQEPVDQQTITPEGNKTK